MKSKTLELFAYLELSSIVDPGAKLFRFLTGSRLGCQASHTRTAFYIEYFLFHTVVI